ncbi:gluconate 2-dehydrogenase subunit 3 family protein [Azohydromonas australica]|uniref:gluconate 2-dehydrogenase subunit 3 family protein n=1 Tax=Azohydromonas australica TaxID=364039 RepID=UPI000416A3BD|nr:gluconate 2-dehydrogenase subunit 3 family protein [Azohydromonas australica]
MARLSRRIFLQVSGAAALVPGAAETAQGPALPAPAAAPAPSGPAAGDMYLFFNAPEAAFIEAAVQRLIPPDEVGPSALEAGVPGYLDKQIHGAWGAGERLYRAGPWQPGLPTQGYQLPFTPAELFRTALRGIREDLQKNGRPAFEQMDGAQQDEYLTLLQTTQRDLAGVPSDVFFESLLGMTIEGYFCDPVYGGNRDMAAWRMIGFPGAYAAFYDLVDRHGVAFAATPRSLSEQAG